MCVHMYMHVCVHLCMYMCVHVYMHVCVHAHVHGGHRRALSVTFYHFLPQSHQTGLWTVPGAYSLT